MIKIGNAPILLGILELDLEGLAARSAQDLDEMQATGYYPIINFGLYCSASAKCADRISSHPAKSAMVRASLRMR